MSDGMDNNQDPLGNISRQLSELAASPSSPPASLSIEATNQNHGIQSPWTQFSGIPSRPGHAPFTSLYTWNSMDLPDIKPLSSTRGAQNIYHPQQTRVNPDPTTPKSGDNDLYQFSWSGVEEPPLSPRFQVTGDLGGRFSEVSRSNSSGVSNGGFGSPQNFAYMAEHSPQAVNHAFPGERSNGGHTMMPPPHHSLAPQAAASYPGMEVPSQLLPNISSKDAVSQRASPDQGLPFRLSCESVPYVSDLGAQGGFVPSQPVFDLSSPPPPFPVQRHHSEDSLKRGSLIAQSKSQEFLDYLRSEEKRDMNLDLGINIDDGGDQNTITESGLESAATEEGKRLYENALHRWHSFELPSSQSSLSGEPQEMIPTQTVKLVEPSLDQPSADTSKPTYSDIAKTPKLGHSSYMNKPEPRGSEAVFKSSSQGTRQSKRESKPRPFVKRTSSGLKFWSSSPRGSLGGDGDQPRMSPSSRYGLDNFDDHVLSQTNHTNSAENLTQGSTLSRRGSGSSVGSTVSAPDDASPSSSSQTISSEIETPQKTQSNNTTEQKSANSAKASKASAACSTKSVSSSSSAGGSSAFFDPRRIFQQKGTKSPSEGLPKKSEGSKATTPEDPATGSKDTVLNNGKPTASVGSSKLPTTAKQHAYINNDLRDASKLTNQTAAETSQAGNPKVEESHKLKESRQGAGKRSGTKSNGVYRKDRKKSPTAGQAEEVVDNGGRAPLPFYGIVSDYLDMEKIEEWLSLAGERLHEWGRMLANSVFHMLVYMLGLVVYLAMGTVHLLGLLLMKSWMLMKEKLFKSDPGSQHGSAWGTREQLRRRVGLEESINLPSTGEEAMKRLLACRGKDPYSILGLRADCTDEDIKKYYRKQAVLVHPDKNQQPGAEESFKILGHAFEMIGEPTKRRSYDSHTQGENEAEAMKEFADMLSKLQTKIQEAANIMRCDNCGGKHRRVPIDRPFYSARFCERCNTRHSAKEGDVWAESSLLGFYWHYYALMEGHVYDITEWMKCHKEFFSNMKANAHAVMYRIATDGNRRTRQGEPNLEDFINRLFNRTQGSSPEGQGQPSWSTPHTGADTGPMGTGVKKGGRRKKKRH